MAMARLILLSLNTKLFKYTTDLSLLLSLLLFDLCLCSSPSQLHICSKIIDSVYLQLCQHFNVGVVSLEPQ